MIISISLKSLHIFRVMLTIIYTLSHPITNEVRYIGKTKNKLPNRLTQHCHRKRINKTTSWIHSLEKQGLKPTIEEIDRCSWNESANLEIFYISLFKSWGFKLTNLTEGGEGTIGCKCSDERKRKISEKAIGNQRWLGKKHTQESKDLISKANKGRKKSEEFAKNRSNYQKSIGWKPHPIMFENMLKSHARKVAQINEKGEIIREFPTIRTAARELGLIPESINKCCRGRQLIHKNTMWKYID